MPAQFAFGRSTQGRYPITAVAAMACAAAAMFAAPVHAAWEPTKPVEFVVPAGTGGGADQMARLIQGIIVKHKLIAILYIILVMHLCKISSQYFYNYICICTSKKKISGSF